MDMFMDKLAQRINAQEIIKANISAETEELNHLRSRAAEYTDCLEKLQKLIEESSEKMKNSQVNGEEIDKLVSESIDKIRALQQDTGALEQLQKSFTERFDEADRKQGECLSSVNRILEEKLEGMDQTLDERLEDMDQRLVSKVDDMHRQIESGLEDAGQRMESRLESMDSTLKEKLEQMSRQNEDDSDKQLLEQLSERIGLTEENVHKECVKVYRNVQAVVVEENNKQSEVLNDVKGKMEAVGKKLKAVMGISIAAVAVSLISVVMQFLL